MRHAAHKSPKGNGASSPAKSLFSASYPSRIQGAAHVAPMSMQHAASVGAHAAAPSRPARSAARPAGRHAAVAATNGVATLDAAVLEKINEVAPMTRRAMRESARAAQRRNTILTSASLAALVGTAATAVAFANTRDDSMLTLGAGETTTTATIERAGDDGAASRSDSRAALTTDNVQATSNEGGWNLGDSNAVSDTNAVSKSIADNENVAKLMAADADALPASFDPNHATGDKGSTYPYGQCTWWAYTRRVQLGLPAGSYFGDARSWGASASALGYWVDSTPRHVGDVVVFAPGQAGASTYYGHVAVVEAVGEDGSIKISESNVEGLGVISNREFTAAEASQFTYIHY